MSVSENVGTCIANAQGGIISRSVLANLIEGHRYYCKVSIKSDSDQVYMFITGLSTKNHSGSGEWEDVEAVFVSSYEGPSQFRIVDGRDSGWTEYQAKEAIIVDLGEDEEPTEEHFKDALLNYSDNSWFIGTASFPLPFDRAKLVIDNGISLESKYPSDIPEVAELDYRPLRDKVIVCFGDSITSSTNNYPEKLAERLKATVYNVGFGGTRMSNHGSATYDKFSMYNLADAIVSSDFSSQEAQLTALPDFTETLTTLKNIDFNNVDYITIFFWSK